MIVWVGCEQITHSGVSVVVSQVVMKDLIGVFVINLQVGVWRDVPANTKTQKAVSARDWIRNQDRFQHWTNPTTNSLIQIGIFDGVWSNVISSDLRYVQRHRIRPRPQDTPSSKHSNKEIKTSGWLSCIMNSQRFAAATFKLKSKLGVVQDDGWELSNESLWCSFVGKKTPLRISV